MLRLRRDAGGDAGGAQGKAAGMKRPRYNNTAKAAQSAGGDADALEHAVFGHGPDVLKHVVGYREEREEDEEETKQQQQQSEGEEESEGEHERGAHKKAKSKSAWVDEDDVAERVDISEGATRMRKLRKSANEKVVSGSDLSSRLRDQFEKIHGGKPMWADKASKARGEDGDEGEGEESGVSQVLQSTAKLLGASKGLLPKSIIDVSRVHDANIAAYSKAVIQCVEFHPNAPALLTGGLDKTLRIFQIDGKKNTLLQSTYFPDLPIHSASFTHSGDEIIVSGRRRFFYSFDLAHSAVRKIPEIQGRSERSLERFWVSPDDKHLIFTANDGTLLMVSNKTKQWVANLKMNGSARNVAFSADGSKMYSSGGDGDVYVWDMNTRDCVHVFHDEGCVSSTSLACSVDGSIAAGSDTGVVNIYSSDSYMGSRDPKPVKAVMNLTTQIDTLSFNHDGQILSLASRMKKDALRFVHVPSLTTFSNWPTHATPLSHVHSMAFSPQSGYSAIGNDKGKVLLFRLNHYKAA